jgi:hypothetical protein
MDNHQFIFSPGEWIGQGKITFSSSPAQLRFYTKWLISEQKENEILAEQIIEQQGEVDLMANSFSFTDLTPVSFKISVSSELLGSVIGKGVIDPKTIAWEFRQPMNPDREDLFEGFEVYELQEGGDYLMHAEYFSGQEYRTIIDGRIWKKS